MSDNTNLEPGLVLYKDNASEQVMVMTEVEATKAMRGGYGRILNDTEVSPQTMTPYEAALQSAPNARVYATVTQSSLNAAITKLSQDLPGQNATLADLVAIMITAYGMGKITLGKIMPLIKSP
jgi:hypothetical protein